MRRETHGIERSKAIKFIGVYGGCRHGNALMGMYMAALLSLMVLLPNRGIGMLKTHAR